VINLQIVVTEQLKRLYLSKKPISQGQYDDLIVERPKVRVWKSRVEKGIDGLPLITVEIYDDRLAKWNKAGAR